MKVMAQTVEDAQVVTMLRALANPARFRIVQHLARTDARSCGDIAEELPLVIDHRNWLSRRLGDFGP